MKITNWMNKKEYRKFMKDNKFIKIHEVNWKYEKEKEFENITDKRLHMIKWNDFIRITYSNLEIAQ